MRDDFKPGDLSVRIAFGRVYGNGPDRGQVRASIEIADQTSGKQITIEITEMLAGGAAEVSADQVQGFRGLARWGKYLKTKQLSVKSKMDDYAFKGDPTKLRHVAEAIAALAADGYEADTPRRNNQGQWVIVGRRYDEQP